MKTNILLIIFLITLSFESFAKKITEITISGNKRIETGTIEKYLGYGKGVDFDEVLNKKIVQNLYSTGLFNNITTDFNNGNLLVKVEEKVFISKVTFVGNNKVKKETFKPYIKTNVGKSLDKDLIKKDIEVLKEIYSKVGRYNALVNSEIEILSSGGAKVIFKISEGPKTGIDNIYFAGNTHYNSEELKSIILTKESKWYRFFTDQDRYDSDLIDNDKILLAEFYTSLGYEDFRIIAINSQLTPNKKYFSLFYSIEEGPRYRLGNVKVENSLSGIDLNRVEQLLTLKSSEFFNKTLAETNANSIKELLLKNGYPEIVVNVEKIKSEKDRIIDVIFKITRAEKVFVGNINITGNSKTQDSVIRRFIPTSEGDFFDSKLLSLGKNNLFSTNYFSNVEVGMTQSNKNTNAVDVTINVEEKSTIEFDAKLGYGSESGVFGSVGFSEKNLFGTGRLVDAQFFKSQRASNLSLDLINPELFSRHLKNGASLLIGSTQSLPLNYTEYRKKGILMLDYYINNSLSHQVKYSLTCSDVEADADPSNISEGADMTNVALGTKIENKNYILKDFYTSSIINELTYNKLDNTRVGKNGYTLSFAQETSGLGGDNKFLKFQTNGKFLKSFMNNNITFSSELNAAMIRPWGSQENVALINKFTLGDTSFRGFDYGGIGPRKKSVDKSSQVFLGGLNYYVITLDLKLPLGTPEELGLFGHIFSDIGSIWGVNESMKNNALDSSALRASIGIGFSLTKGAPMRIDFAIPIMKQTYDKEATISLRLSNQ